jgi:2-dehydro-3-deoxyphosphooctonate aldolase (KDO 8-P synthase)
MNNETAGSPRTQVMRIGDVVFGGGHPLLVIAGPCVIDSQEIALEIAGHVAEVCRSAGVPFVFKASFDKANRTSGTSFRGMGLEKGLAVLHSIGKKLAVPVTTDIHESHQAAQAAEVCELLQIPAFLARQTDLLVAAAKTGRAVNVKKGQFMSPQDMQFVVQKLSSAGCGNMMLTERGTFFGYGRLVNDFAGLVAMRSLGVPVAFDATHSVQMPGGTGGVTLGNREMVAPLARAAVAAGVDAIFLETHPDPDRSPSDAANIFPLDQFANLLESLLAIDRARRAGPKVALQTGVHNTK